MTARRERTHVEAARPRPRPEHDQFLRQPLEPVEDLWGGHTSMTTATLMPFMSSMTSMPALPLEHGIDLVEEQPPGIAVELALGGTQRVHEGASAAQHRFASGLRPSFTLGQLLREFLKFSQEHDMPLLAGHELLLATLASVGPVVVVITATGKGIGRLLLHPRGRGRHERHRAIQPAADSHGSQFANERRRPRRLGRLVAQFDQAIPQHPLEPRLRMPVTAPLDPSRNRAAGLRIGQRQSVGEGHGQVIGTPGPLPIPIVARQCGHDVSDQGGIHGSIGVDHLHLIEPQPQPQAGAQDESHLVRFTGRPEHRRAFEAGKRRVVWHGRIGGQHLHIDPRRCPQGVEQVFFEPWRIEIVGYEEPPERLGQRAFSGVIHRERELAGDVDQLHLPQLRRIQVHEQGEVVGLV